MMTDREKVDTENKKTISIFLFGKISATLIIPAEIARECGLQNKVVVERKNGGIFIRKLKDDC